MKRFLVCLGFCMAMMFPTQSSFAQIPVLEIIRQAVTKVIKAVDLKIQRLQNKTIWLQNAQKTLENKMQELKLGEISDWVEKQRKLYAEYYEELWKVKSTIAYYGKVKDIIQKQVAIVDEYKKAAALFRQDKQFSPPDITYMENVYRGILEQSAKNLEGLLLVIHSFATQMSDGSRLEIIHAAEKSMEQNLTDLRQFTQQNIHLSLRRARDAKEIQIVKALYGIQ